MEGVGGYDGSIAGWRTVKTLDSGRIFDFSKFASFSRECVLAVFHPRIFAYFVHLHLEVLVELVVYW